MNSSERFPTEGGFSSPPVRAARVAVGAGDGPHDKPHTRGGASAEASQNLFTQEPVPPNERQPERLRAHTHARRDSAEAKPTGVPN